MEKSLLKSSLREIKSSLGRYIAILLIVALGVGFFAGLMVSESAMLKTGDRYLAAQNYYDYRLLSTIGFEKDDVATLAKGKDVAHADGAFRVDAFVTDGKRDGEFVGRIHSITKDVNKLKLKEGRLPENDKECVADSAYYHAEDVGRIVTITDSNDKDTQNALESKTMKIVGIVDSPLNMRMGSLSTELGSGEVAAIYYAPESAFTAEYYSEIFLDMNVPGQIYTEEYDNAIKKHTDAITALTEKCVNARYDDIVKQVNAGRDKAEQGLAMAKQGVAQAKAMGAPAETITEAEAQQKKAQDALDSIKTPKAPDVYVLTRDEDVGYQFFKSDSSIVSAIAKVFPIFFFLVAALVCVTTMTRMMNEQRTQIGVFKSMGYSNGKILSKYMIYSGSSGLLGCILGYFLGTWGFPTIFWTAYSTYYAFPDKIMYVFDAKRLLISLVVSLVCTMGVTWICGRSDLSKTAANLIRPKAPKAGKRNPLERVKPVWNSLSFLQKITVRNLFRYKNRFFMMLLGIGGCTALIVTGLALQDNFEGVADVQYGQIDLYDASAIFNRSLTENERADLETEFAKDIDKMLYAYTGSVDISANGITHSLSLNAPVDAKATETFFDWHDGEKSLSFPKDNEILLDRGMAERLGVSAGDEVVIRDSDMHEATFTVSGVFDNYISNNSYITRNTLKNDFGQTDVNSAYMIFKDGVDSHKTAARMMSKDFVTRVSVVEDSMDMFGDMLDSLDLIVVVIILCAGLLAFIVLYNLTNINISERIREIATLKVLGFYGYETNAYVFRENTALSVCGALFGLLLGKALHAFVMAQIVVDGLRFDAVVSWQNYVIAFVLTMIFAMVTQLIMRRKISKIHMAESLKSVE